MSEDRLERLKACMARAKRKGELTIGFLGGSITQGSLSSSETTCYAYLVYKWWVKAFPEATFHYVNGGIGGTTSQFGAARAAEDVLRYQPDFVAVDFSVNDDPTPFFQETFEGVIRKVLSWQSKPAVLILNNVFYDTGVSAQKEHNEVAAHYGVPYASIRDSVYQEIKNGTYRREEITPDGLHPNDKGHRLVADALIRVLEQAKRELEEEGEGKLPYKGLPKPITQNAYEHAKRLTISNAAPELAGFVADPREKMGHLDFFKNGWIGRRAGDKIVFEVESSLLAVQYRKTIHKPSPVAKLTIDGQKEAVILDGNFEEDWGDCLYIETILHHAEKKRRRIEIEIIEAAEEDKAPFYLLSLIEA